MSTIEEASQEPAAPPRPIRRRPLHHVAVWTAFGTLTYSGAQAAILMVLAKLSSDASIVGDYALAFAVAAPITALGRLGMRPLVATETSAELRFQDYLGVQLLTMPICLALLAAIAFLGPFHWAVSWTILTLGCAKLFESTGTVFYGLMDRHERQRRIAQSMFIKGVGGVVAVGIAFSSTHSTAWCGAALAIWWLACLLLGDVPLAVKLCRADGVGTRLVCRPKLGNVRRIAGLSFSVGATAAIRELNIDLPSYFIRVMQGRAAVGYYAAVVAVNKLSRIIFRGFNQAASPRLAQYYRYNPRAFLKLSIKMLMMCGGMGAIAVVVAATIGGWVLGLVYKPDYAQYQTVLVWLSVEVALGLGAVAVRQSLIAARYLHAQMGQALLTTAVLVICCAILIPKYGLNGAAMACVISSAFDLITGAIALLLLFRSRQSEAAAAIAPGEPAAK